ncbi:MAG: putative membrane protein (DUF2306) [Rhodobacteraceae bacterium HLUCCA12]|nr:MAG: putative membrane protein (DUF2306) [Rhodobacteraceae bacterium HLUCCA12]
MTQILLFLHILAGVAALAAAGVAIASTKGGRMHRRSGNAYALAMLITGTTALVLAIIHPDAFLFAVGLFSLFLVFTGWRAAMVRDGRPRWPDHAAGAVMALAGLGMLGWGLVGILGGATSQAVIVLAFGSIGLTMALADWRDWTRAPITGKARIARHLGRMLGGTIATITAAGVVNLGFLPDLLVWLGPTVLITPVIVWWTARVMRGGPRPT